MRVIEHRVRTTESLSDWPIGLFMDAVQLAYETIRNPVCMLYQICTRKSLGSVHIASFRVISQNSMRMSCHGGWMPWVGKWGMGGAGLKPRTEKKFGSRFLFHLRSLASSVMMSTLAARCQWEHETVRERTGHPPSYVVATKMKSLTLHTHAS